MANMKTIRAYTMGYDPFILGGSCYHPIAADVEAEGPFPIGRGYKAYLVTAPNGKTFVAEATTGAFIGPNLEAVCKDVKTGDPKLMKEQVADSREQAKQAKAIPAAELWTRLKCGRLPGGKE